MRLIVGTSVVKKQKTILQREIVNSHISLMGK